MLSEELLAELTAICDGAKEMAEGGYTLVYLPGLKIRTGDHAFSQDALLCLQARDGYPTRLFLSQQIQGPRPVWEGQKCVLNLVPCDNDFEREFAKFLDNAKDVTAFAKLPRAFGFTIEYTDTSMNLRNYEPDFVAIDKSGVNWLLESKGQENVDVLRKDVAAVRWCENASKLTDKQWKYAKVPQKEFEALQPTRLADLAALMPSLFDEVEG